MDQILTLIVKPSLTLSDKPVRDGTVSLLSWGGDWNATPSMEDVAYNLDVIFIRNLPSRYRSEKVVELAEDLDLSDPFRALHPDSKEFSYYPSGNLRRNRSHIDFFLVSSGLYNNIQSCSIAQGFCRKSFDHKPIFWT
jgi:exonuclease III